LTQTVTIRRVWPPSTGDPGRHVFTVIVRHALDEVVLWTRDRALAAEAERLAEPPRAELAVRWSPSHQLLEMRP